MQIAKILESLLDAKRLLQSQDAPSILKSLDNARTALGIDEAGEFSAGRFNGVAFSTELAKLVGSTAAGLVAGRIIRVYSALGGAGRLALGQTAKFYRLGEYLDKWRFNNSGVNSNGKVGKVALVTELAVAEAVAQFIDAINDLNLGVHIYDAIHSDVNLNYQNAQNFVQYVDPLVLDLDGDGIETISANSGITFDFNADGLKNGTGWLSGDDVFLVLDRNGNGTIDNGSELFGVDTVKSDGTLAKDGFDALRDLDSNGDGIFDAYDLLFEQMRVWQDKNQDGISQADELKSLNELGINAIHLDNSSSNRLDNGNRISATDTIELSDGTTGTAANIDLASNPFYREFLDNLSISKAIKNLPNMHGSGAVRDLQEAASQSKELANLLKQYSKLPTREKQRAMLDTILGTWAKTADYPNLSQRLQKAAGDNVEVELQFSWQQKDSKPTEEQLALKSLLKKTAILEVFNASDFYKITRRSDGKFILQAGTSSTVLSAIKTADGKEKLVITENNLQLNAGRMDLLNKAYDSLSNSVHQGLLLQTRLKPYLEAIDIAITEEGIALDYNGVYKAIDDKKASDPVKAILTSFELQELLQDSNLSTELENRRSVWISKLDERGINRLQAQINDGYFIDLQVAHLVVVTNASDTLYGKNISDSTSQLYGGAGDDILQVYAYSKDNLLAGGTGNDTLYGSNYSDTYLFNLGDDKDTIIESYNYSNAVDTLRFGEDIKSSDISTYKDGRDLLFKHKNGKDEVRVKDVFNNTSNGAFPRGYRNLDLVEFADGTIWTWQQIAERGLISQAHNNGETLNSWTGNDIMQGGKGDDILYGSYYSDTYLFNRGDGQDTIVERNNYNDAIDIVQFGKDINMNNLWFERNGSHLIVSINKTDDQITIRDWYSGRIRRVEEFHLANGKILLESQVQYLVDAMAAFSGSSSAEGEFIPMPRQELDRVIAVNWQ